MANKKENIENLDENNIPDLGNAPAEDVVEAKEKEVKVRGLENHKCTIGNTIVIVEKGKEQKMTVGVAMLMQNANIVAILA